jgi:catechol 2,3-dioxygenase-like lactoylglutathione lyase family enzyme
MTGNGITGIDHVLIAVQDLDDARMGWTKLGFNLSPRGKHLGRGSGNYCVMFERDYIELFGIIGPEPASPEYVAFLAEREGGMKLAWATADARAASAALAARGLHPSEPRALSRQLELPEGTAVPRFDIVALPLAETPGIESFLCAHLTPELMRRPAWLSHPNGAIGIIGVTVLVEDTAALLEPYERLFGAANVSATDALLTVRLGRHHIVFASEDDFGVMHPELEPPSASQGPIAAITLRSRDIAVTSEYLTSWQIEYEMADDGSLVVPAKEASGVAIEFATSHTSR